MAYCLSESRSVAKNGIKGHQRALEPLTPKFATVRLIGCSPLAVFTMQMGDL